ncbi:MAG: PP2C family protein-serine/threonine phosphatase [Fibromonadaceae bacterium]|jgi:serine phosphatase RsbU (regulator of sigma subunit)|nr:PP2C family protein-serine/threonine phosphatase [Fibromonadaceae bacterium]
METTETKDTLGLAETLRRQLMTYYTSSEIAKITAQAQSVEAVYKGLCLGFRDLAGYNKVMVLGIDTENFCLEPLHSVGFDEAQLEGFRPEIDVMAGEYAEAIFCNKHVLSDPVPEFDAFAMLGSKAYIVSPMMARVTEKCWEAKNCNKENCPCYSSETPYCWVNPNAGLALNAASEDEKRRVCVKCSQFKCEGLLWIDLTDKGKITGEDATMISATVSQAGLAIESFRVHESLKLTNEKLNSVYDELKKAHSELKSDLHQANIIQHQLLPSTFPETLSDVAADYKATMDVGGDYYDCFDLPNGKIGLVVADVSGHGTAAAMMMAMFKIMLKNSPHSGTSPALTLKNINETFVNEIDSGKFITVFYATWCKETREFVYSSAGHNPMPLMNKKTGEIKQLKSSGLFLGVMPDITVEDEILKLSDDHRIAIYTDGINEAMNPAKEQFGHKRIHELLQKNTNESCRDFLEYLSDAVKVFRDGNELDDDLTILVCDL